MKSTTLVRLLVGLLGTLLLAAACSDSSNVESTADVEPEVNGVTTETTSADDEDMADESGEEMADDEGGAEDEDMADESGDGVFPAVIATSSGDVTIEARPERIVSMSATATEMLFGIGAGGLVVAADSYSNYPAEAPTTDLSAFEPSLEAIAGHEPDLVVLSNDNPEIQDGLAAIDVPVIVLAAATTIDDTYDQIAQLGVATGSLDGAAALNAEIRSGIDAILAQVGTTDATVRVYHELDDTFFSASSASFIGQLYAMLGFENIADPADPDGFGFPQLQVDQIIAGDPTLIVFTDAYGYGAADIAARPGWDTLSAVSANNIIEVNADVASRWGPRIVEFLQLVVDGATVSAG